MTSSAPANQPHPGARWWKFDFHTHTPASKDTYWAKHGVELTPETWLLKYMAAEIDCVAITDHNTGEWIDKLKKSYARLKETKPEGFRELHLFPGVEISVNGGYHLLALLDCDKGSRDITKLLGTDYQGTPGDSDGETEDSLQVVLAKLVNAGALVIPAHADGEKGVLQLKQTADGCTEAKMSATALRQIFASGHVLAAEFTERDAKVPGLYNELAPNWTRLAGSDCHSFQEPGGPGSRFTWIKMGKPCLEGLRLALLDGPSTGAIWCDRDDTHNPHATPSVFLRSLTISNASVMGRRQPAALRFSPGLNALIGGRGTGKSTIVHALRIACGREEILPERGEAWSTFERFNTVAYGRKDTGALLGDTEIRAELDSDEQHYRLTWHQGRATQVERWDGARWVLSENQQVAHSRFPIQIYSQGQIAELAGKNTEALLRVVDEGTNASAAKADIDEAKREYRRLRHAAHDLELKTVQESEVREELAIVRRKLAVFEGKEHDDVLTQYQLRRLQDRELRRQVESARGSAGTLAKIGDSLLLNLEDIPDSIHKEGDPGSDYLVEFLAGVGRALDTASAQVTKTFEELRDSLNASANALEEGPWADMLREAMDRHEALVVKLREQGVTDPGAYGRLVQERERLKHEHERLSELSAKKEKLDAQAEVQLEEVRAARRRLIGQRADFLREKLEGNPYVQISVVPYGDDASAIASSLRELLRIAGDKFAKDILEFNEDDKPTKGVVADLFVDRPKDAVESQRVAEERLNALRKRLVGALDGEENFGRPFSKALKKLAQEQPDILDQVELWAPEDTLAIRYSRSGDGNKFESIGRASAGQRAAAMLAFLLTHGKEPLVLDQPEDDLDNHLIYNLVVKQILHSKSRRQLIVITHNPNIVINGSAEWVQTFHFSGGECQVKERGALQDAPIQTEVCEIMEGGRVAFLGRYRRLATELES